jgi:hypothetical protein
MRLRAGLRVLGIALLHWAAPASLPRVELFVRLLVAVVVIMLLPVAGMFGPLPSAAILVGLLAGLAIFEGLRMPERVSELDAERDIARVAD